MAAAHLEPSKAPVTGSPQGRASDIQGPSHGQPAGQGQQHRKEPPGALASAERSPPHLHILTPWFEELSIYSHQKYPQKEPLLVSMMSNFINHDVLKVIYAEI